MKDFFNKLFKIAIRKIKKGIVEDVKIVGRVTAVLEDMNTGEKIIIKGKNIVTNGGDKYYAQMSAGEAPTDDFASGGCKLGTGVTAATKNDTDIETDIGSSYKTAFSGYPKTNDTESGDGGVDKVTHKFLWGIAEANANNISECAIVDADTATNALQRLLFSTAFDKVSSQTLIVYITHEFNGV